MTGEVVCKTEEGLHRLNPADVPVLQEVSEEYRRKVTGSSCSPKMRVNCIQMLWHNCAALSAANPPFSPSLLFRLSKVLLQSPPP